MSIMEIIANLRRQEKTKCLLISLRLKKIKVFINIYHEIAIADDFFTTMVENKLQSPANALKLKQEDIKNISTKLRFASTDEIKKMDEK